jgi:glycosyltransferase involved in cell wall biosynthesis
MNEKFSVIIPLFNKGPYIARAMRSVFNQTVQDFEIIVVDGGSQDDGPKIVKDFFDPRIHFFIQSGKGVSNARNEGVNNAENEFIAFLDADDEWMPKHLETIIRLIEKYPNAGMYTTAYKIHTSEGLTRWANYQYIPNEPWEGLLPDYFRSGALGEYPVWTSVVVIPRKIFHEVGGFPEGYWWAEDADLFGKIALKYPVAFSWVFGAIYHWDAENRACHKMDSTIALNFEDEPFIHTAHAALEKQEVPLELIGSLNEYIARREIVWVHQYIKNEEYKKARAILKQCKTQWFYEEKEKLLYQLNFRYPLILFLKEVRTNFYNIVRKLYPSVKWGK